jgi:hypothetical protein
MSITPQQNQELKEEMQPVIDDLKKKGVKFNSTESEVTGLGDIVESTLQSFGITEERFKRWFSLNECGCKERKKWLNGLFSWKQKS